MVRTVGQWPGKIYYHIIDWLSAYSQLRNWSITEVLDYTTIPYGVKVSYSHLNYPWLNFGNDIFWCNYFMFLIIKSGFLCVWSTQPSILTEVTIMLDDYFKTKPGVKDLPWPGIKPHSTATCDLFCGTRSC